MKERLMSYGVPELRAQDALTRDSTRSAMQLAEQLARGKGRILVLSSLAGRGKSTAAAFALTLRSGLWVHSPKLTRPYNEQDESAISDAEMRKAGLLVIDDLGTEHSPGGYAASRVNDVVVFREGAGGPTLITTNLTGQRFREVYGERIASRINAADEPLGWRRLDGPDLRAPITPQLETSPTDLAVKQSPLPTSTRVLPQ